MNKFPQYLVRASLAALLIALLGGLWLVWQTLEESRALERHNRELQASLEASRIRIENFCDYPNDALCRMDERTGNVAGVMNEFLQETHASPQHEADFDPAKTLYNAMNPASKAMDTVKKVAEAQALVAAEVKSPVQEKPSSQIPPVAKPAPTPEKKAEPTPLKAVKPEDKKDASVASKIAKQDSTNSLPAKETKQIDTPAASTAEKAVSQTTGKTEASKSTGNAPVQDEEIVPERTYQHEVSGKISTTLPEAKTKIKDKNKSRKSREKSTITKKSDPKHASAPSVKKTAERKVVRKTSSPTQKQNPSEIRKSWSRVEDDGGIFSFTITGSGATLPAEGALKADPWRYELVLDGRWEVRAHSGIDNRLVSFMTTATRDGNTVLTFLLKSKPYRCSLHRPDSRTATLRIR